MPTLNPSDIRYQIIVWQDLMFSTGLAYAARDGERGDFPVELLDATNTIAIWCDSGQCNVDPKPILDCVNSIRRVRVVKEHSSTGTHYPQIPSEVIEHQIDEADQVIRRILSVLNAEQKEPAGEPLQVTYQDLSDICSGLKRPVPVKTLKNNLDDQFPQPTGKSGRKLQFSYSEVREWWTSKGFHLAELPSESTARQILNRR